MDAYVYAQHSAKCPHRANKFWRKCRCRKWIYESGTRRRYSAKTRSWEQAEKQVASDDPRPVGKSLADAISDYLSDKKEQNIGSEWLEKLTYDLQGVLLPWCDVRNIRQLSELDNESLKEFRKDLTGNPLTRSKKQERLRSFFLYCQRHGWIRENPAALLSKIKVNQVPTDFFTQDEFEKILAAVSRYHSRGAEPERARQRARGMLLLLRWSGLRLGDAARLERARLDADGRLLLYMAKTGDPVYVRLSPEVAEELRAVPNGNPVYFFWTGNGDRKTVVDDWWRTLSRIFKHAELGKRAHPHMFRDTFAIHLLLSGAKMEEVQMLLGHKSIRVTQAHYAPWSRARQDLLDEVVRKSWG